MSNLFNFQNLFTELKNNNPNCRNFWFCIAWFEKMYKKAKLWLETAVEEELGLIGIFYGQYMPEIVDWLRSNNTLYNKCKQTLR